MHIHRNFRLLFFPSELRSFWTSKFDENDRYYWNSWSAQLLWNRSTEFFWNFVVMKDIMCRCAYPQETLIPFFSLEATPSLNLEIWPQRKILPKQLVSATPLKPLNRIYWRSYHKEYSCKISKLYTHNSKVISKVKVFKKWVKLQGQGHRVKIIVPTERSYHKEYSCEISKLYSTHCSKVIRKVKVFKK